MALIDENTKVIVQGITGHHGSFHTRAMMDAGTNIVAGVTPGKGGQEVEGVPVYNTIKEALAEHDADWSVVFVPARFVKDAAIEALNAGLNLVIISENVPVHDTLEIVALAQKKKKMLFGPNCPGMINPGCCKLGIIPASICKKGNIGIVSRSGTLTYEIINEMSKHDLGQSTVFGIGGDPVIGTDFIDILKIFEKDKETEMIVLVGEIGSDAEEIAADFIKAKISKKVVAYIVGKTAPPEKRMGHAGAIISSTSGTAQAKIDYLTKLGIPVAEIPSEIVDLLKR